MVSILTNQVGGTQSGGHFLISRIKARGTAKETHSVGTASLQEVIGTQCHQGHNGKATSWPLVNRNHQEMTQFSLRKRNFFLIRGKLNKDEHSTRTRPGQVCAPVFISKPCFLFCTGPVWGKGEDSQENKIKRLKSQRNHVHPLSFPSHSKRVRG